MIKNKRIGSGRLLAVLAVILAGAWGTVYGVGGTAGVVSWWFLQLILPLFGTLIFLGTAAYLLLRLCKRRAVTGSWIGVLLLSMIAAWPALWFTGIGQMAYPAREDQVQPAASIRLPLNQTVQIGWGGNRVETNYHVIAPNERWAYDLLVPPAGLGSPRLEDYGIYGQEVVAPASGTVISAHGGEPDHAPGVEESETLAGNHVYLRLDETGTYLVMAHLMQGSVQVKTGDHVTEGTPIGRVGNSGSSSEPHLHIHHQRQDPFTTNLFLSEGLPLYFRDIEGPPMPLGGIRLENGREVPSGDLISPRS